MKEGVKSSRIAEEAPFFEPPEMPMSIASRS